MEERRDYLHYLIVPSLGGLSWIGIVMSAFTTIPVIDLSDPQPKILRQLHHAITSVGFMYVKNHGVPQYVIDDIVELLPDLFSLPEHEKSAIELENSPHFLGYSSVGSETTAGRTDLREQFEFATELQDTWSVGLPLYERLKGPNQWPSISRARPVIERYIAELTSLSSRFVQLVAESLELESNAFVPFLSDQHRLKIVHYPSNETSGQGVGPHKDSSGWWTFLLQASPPEIKGLQALNKDGQWIDVPNLPGTFVVNIGQAFEVVTRGFCKATTHRVLAGEFERYSLPFFQGVRRDLTKKEALETFAEEFKIGGKESDEGAQIDSAFLRGKYDTWGESQLRTKIRSHRLAGKNFYNEIFDSYVNDDG